MHESELAVEWSVAKPVQFGVLVWRLAAGFNPPSDSSIPKGLYVVRRLVMRVSRQAIAATLVGSWNTCT